MRLTRFALAALVILVVAGQGLAQQAPQGQQQGQGRGGGRGGQAEPPIPVPPSSYKTYVNREDFFSVHVPCDFGPAQKITWISEYENPLPGNVYTCNRGQEKYTMTVINYTDVQKIMDARETTDAAQQGGNAYARIDVYASIDFAAMKLRQKATKVNFDAWHYVDLIPGHQVQFTTADGMRNFASIYLHNYRLYILEAVAPPTAPPPGLFQQSLSILDAEGNRIRYRSIYQHPW
jgi:hypothetical protein